ncbi:hypothetical protein D3C73_871250 [compost metagenome]
MLAPPSKAVNFLPSSYEAFGLAFTKLRICSEDKISTFLATVAIELLVLKLITGAPEAPFLVVIKITPFDALEP